MHACPRTLVFARILLSLLALMACGGDDDASTTKTTNPPPDTGDDDDDDDPSDPSTSEAMPEPLCDASKFELRCAEKQRAECSACLDEMCCMEIKACQDDPACSECFSTGNYTGCGEHATPIIICSAWDCGICNGCYGPG